MTAAVLVICGCSGASLAEAQTAANVLLVVNRESPASDAVARHYIERRGIPQDNICAIHLTPTETVSRDDFESQIQLPIWHCITSTRAQDRILYIVLTKDIPIRIAGTGGRTGTVASVDSELSLTYRSATGHVVPIAGFVPNPYFAGATRGAAGPQGRVGPFGHDAYDIYLVTRLDGYTVQDVEALIDKGSAPVADGRFILDGRGALVDSGGDAWLRTAAQELGAQGLGERVVLDESSKVLTHEGQVLGYYSWGSNDPAFRNRHLGLDFVPGALAATFVSTDARTFKEPPPTWSPANSATPASIYAGSHQSLIADLIREGATGVAGHVDEPYLDGTIRPDVLFPAYASGRNLAEAFYAAMPYLSWQTVVIGDPLCAPFQKAPRPAQEIDPGYDARTEMPAYFSKRRLETMSQAVKMDAALAYLRYESRRDRKDAAGARQALETAVIADSSFTSARVELAQAQQRDGQIDRAMANYEAVLKYQPNNLIALNNVAYDLATRRGKPADALPLAERAVGTAKSSATLDTLAWTQHLLGQDLLAAETMRQARAMGGALPEILLHSAAIYAAVNDVARATAELNAALKAKPDLANQDDVKKLQLRLSAK